MSDKVLKWDKFIELVRDADSTEQLKELFNFLFTHEEKQHIVTRIQLVCELLSQQKTQREIAKSLDISIAKITRGSNNLKSISDELRRYLMRELVKNH
ncbi:MAG: trp operon repressor [Gammaproteobacteria bacterium]|nr:trp operon repressor [Gammaproteobacteria bacterium]